MLHTNWEHSECVYSLWEFDSESTHTYWEYSESERVLSECIPEVHIHNGNIPKVKDYFRNAFQTMHIHIGSNSHYVCALPEYSQDLKYISGILTMLTSVKDLQTAEISSLSIEFEGNFEY